MATQIFEHNIPELHSIYSKSHPGGGDKALTTLVSTERPDLGSFHVSNMTLPNMHLMDVRWGIHNELTIHETYPSQTVDINFVLEGNIRGAYRGLGTDMELRSGTNNFKFTPFEKSSHRAVRQNVNLFAIALEKSYFQDLIGHDNAWAEGIQRKLEKDENFFGAEQFQAMTPRMHALIHSIQNMPTTPMTRLMTQSLVFELIAQQIDQLACLTEVKPGGDAISANDIDKLHNAKLYIDQHFLEDITLTGICREVMLNEFKLKKGFKILFGTSVMQYARQLRMEFAKDLLRDNRMTVEAVASKLGYRFPNHFSVAYKKHFGVAPSQRS